ncbi:hypothetical protein EDC04DRAFT_3060194 [Pisolithus marmoratus]|nr:hypothetical protein EDC04DRAFT_3060194 [Pisolithus marmoratus]
MVRQKLEEQFSLEPGTLEANEYKSTIKAAVITNLDEVRASVAACEPPVLVAKGKSNHAASPNKKRKSDRKEEKGTSKRMRKVRMVESSAEESETDAKHERKSRDVPPDLPKAIKSQKKLKNNESKPKVENGSKLESGKFKSKAIIDTSEDEKTEEKPTSPRTSKSKDKKRAQATPTKPTSKPSSNVCVVPSCGSFPKTLMNAKVISNVDLTRNEAPAASSSKLASPAKAKAVVDGCDEESELSSLIDEPPKKQRKKQGESDSRTSKRGKKAKEPLPKDEATVSKLKAIVVACGVRKVWKKEFQGLDRPKQQINRLHEILAELGMTPRYTMEKARDIKRKREFDQELQDVKAFEEAQRERERRKQAGTSESDSDEPSNSDSVPLKKKKTARASIMAFLEDQSDEE